MFLTGGLILSLFVSLVLCVIPTVTAQKADFRQMEPLSGKPTPSKTSNTDAEKALIRATEEYKESLKQLLTLREEYVRRAGARRDRFLKLRNDGLISKLELEEAEKGVLESQSAAEEVSKQLKAADIFLTESLADSEIKASADSRPAPSTSVKRVQKTAYIRFLGSGNWSLSGIASIESFFLSRFGRRLPVSTIGQSMLHNRWCWDHRNSVDVGLNPDSPEGQALISFLRGAGIPFLAFRKAVPGSSTGPHIHIGFPSHRIPNCTPSI